MNRRSPKSGSILVIVMVTLIFTATALVMFLEKANNDLAVDARVIVANRLRREAYSAVEVTLATLVDFGLADNGLHSTGEGWGDPLKWAGWTPDPGHTVEVSFQDESAKIPLNHADSAVRFAGTVIVVNYAHACACGWRAGRGAAAPLAVTAGVGPVTPVIPRLLLGLIVDGLRVVKEPAGVINLLAALGTLVLIGYGPDATAVAIGESLATLLEGSPPESIRSVVADVRAAFVTAHK